jgi:hypothetical protein
MKLLRSDVTLLEIKELRRAATMLTSEVNSWGKSQRSDVTVEVVHVPDRV